MSIEIVQRLISGRTFEAIVIGGEGDNEKLLLTSMLDKYDYPYLNEVDEWEDESGDPLTFEEKYYSAILSIKIPATQIFESRALSVGQIKDMIQGGGGTDPDSLAQRVSVVEGGLNDLDGRVTTVAGDLTDLEGRVTTVEETIEDFNSDLYVEEPEA